MYFVFGTFLRLFSRRLFLHDGVVVHTIASDFVRAFVRNTETMPFGSIGVHDGVVLMSNGHGDAEISVVFYNRSHFYTFNIIHL